MVGRALASETNTYLTVIGVNVALVGFITTCATKLVSSDIVGGSLSVVKVHGSTIRENGGDSLIVAAGEQLQEVCCSGWRDDR